MLAMTNCVFCGETIHTCECPRCDKCGDVEVDCVDQEGVASAMKTMRTCDAAVAVLRETNNPAVMWGDEGLCHMIAERAQMRTRGRAWKTSDRVLENLSRNHDGLIAGKTLTMRGRRVRIFWLPEHAPKVCNRCGRIRRQS